MVKKIRGVLTAHISNNINTYFFLLLMFVAGVSAGAFTVNGLSSIQKSELTIFFKVFWNFKTRVDSNEIMRISVVDNIRIAAVLWLLGVTIIGIPLYYFLNG